MTRVQLIREAWCDNCEQFRPFEDESAGSEFQTILLGDDTEACYDLVCSTCHWVVATIRLTKEPR